MVTAVLAFLIASSPTTAPTDTLPCNVPVADDGGQQWLFVRGKGFTFCVPPTWKPVGKPGKDADQTTWRSGTSSIKWTLGRVPSGRNLANASAVVSASDLARARSGGYSSEPLPAVERQSVTEMIGDQEVNVWNNRRTGTERQTGAEWTKPAFYFQGEAGDMIAAELELNIYRTVRLTTP